jgi:hypothetical protein
MAASNSEANIFTRGDEGAGQFCSNNIFGIRLYESSKVRNLLVDFCFHIS